jgi:hypothetical protein
MPIPDDERTLGEPDVEVTDPDDAAASPLPAALAVPLEVPQADAIEQALEVEGDDGYPRQD